MSDTIVATGKASVIHPDGQFVAQCVDCINVGEKVEEYNGSKEVLQKCVLVFRTGELNPETGESLDISKEFTVSMGEKANLRKFLEMWRGKQYTNEQVKEGVPLHKLTGNYGLITVAHKVSGKGNLYAIIAACVGIPKQLEANKPVFGQYTRADFWEKRKKEYAAAVAEFRKTVPTGNGALPTALQDEDDDLPF